MGATNLDCTLTPGRTASRTARAARMSCLLAIPAMSALVIHELLAGNLSGAARQVPRASLPWIGLAIALEVLSYLMYATAQRCLLGRETRGPGVRWLASLAVSAQGVANFVPAGFLAAALLNFRQLRRRGLAPSASAWLLVRSSGLYIGGLALLTLIAGEIAGGAAGGSLEGARVGAAALLAAVPVAGLTARLLLKRGVIRLPGAWRMSGGPSRVSAPAAAGAAGLFGLSWVCDGCCLLAALHAMGAHPAWMLVPIAYCAAQLASFVPITPGGVGLVEGTLLLGLPASGRAGAVLAAVLLYRIISYWGTLPFGLLGYLAVRRSGLAASGDPDPAALLGAPAGAGA